MWVAIRGRRPLLVQLLCSTGSACTIHLEIILDILLPVQKWDFTANRVSQISEIYLVNVSSGAKKARKHTGWHWWSWRPSGDTQRRHRSPFSLVSAKKGFACSGKTGREVAVTYQQSRKEPKHGQDEAEGYDHPQPGACRATEDGDISPEDDPVLVVPVGITCASTSKL